jgi:CubicO group peptidase (beta-lactamase class C family)
MTGRVRLAAVALAVLFGVVAAVPAQAAKQCGEPGGEWERATPAEAGMDAAKLQEALDYGSSQLSYAVRVYRHGCLVGEDRAAPTNRNRTYESWSMAKSITSMIFARAMRMGLIYPEDPVGALVPEADGPHGRITMRDLLTMTSGLRWNGFRDYNIFTMPDRVRDALTLDMVHEPGTYFEYAQSAVTLLAEAVTRAAAEDIRSFAQRELMEPLGITEHRWHWERDDAGHVQGFYGVNMWPDDFGRLGELMRRGGVWRGRQLLSRRWMRQAIAPSHTNGCYGWLIWVNAGAPCIGPTVEERPVEPGRDFPDLPSDMYHFAGLFGQRVTVFPTLGLHLVRTGHDPAFTGGDWERELYVKVLAAVTDQQVEQPGAPRESPGAKGSDVDYGFGTSLREPDQYSRGVVQDPLPPAGPHRARAAHLQLARAHATRRGVVRIRLWCPPRWQTRPGRCQGSATLSGAKRVRYDVAPSGKRLLRFRLRARQLRALRRAGTAALTATATNSASGGSTPTHLEFTVRAPRR